MLPKYHLLIGALASLILYLLFHLSYLQASVIFLSSFLIDFDHYLCYVYRKRKLSPYKSFGWFIKRRERCKTLSKEERQGYKPPILIFHGIEFWTIILLLSFLYPIFLFVLIGIAVHMFLDFIELYYLKFPIYSKSSQLFLYWRNKTRK